MTELDPAVRRRHKLRNLLQAVLLLGGMAGMLGLLAWLVFGPLGLAWALVAGVGAALLRPRIPAAWILQVYGARPLPARVAPESHRYLRILCGRAGLEHVPELHYIASPILNALAVGRRDDAALAVTDGLLRNLTGRELAGILAHEVSHIRSDDLWIMSLSDTVGRLTHLLAYLGLFALVLGVPASLGGTLWPLLIALALSVTPTVVTLLQLALARSREYDADLEAAALTGDPDGLARALQTLARHEGRIWERVMVPHGGTPDPLLLRTHPPIEERVRRLRALAPRPDRERLGGGEPVAPRGRSRVTDPARLRFPGIWR